MNLKRLKLYIYNACMNNVKLNGTFFWFRNLWKKKSRQLYHQFFEGVLGMKKMEFKIRFFIEAINRGVNFTMKLIVHNSEL
jgi:hypothetical protein